MTGEQSIVVGIGYRSGVTVEQVIALVQRVCSDPGGRRLAAPAFRHPSLVLETAAKRLGMVLVWIEDEALAQRQEECVTLSERAFEMTGFSSVAEGCALAGAGEGSVLIVPRQAGDGVTCAVALGRGAEQP